MSRNSYVYRDIDTDYQSRKREDRKTTTKRRKYRSPSYRESSNSYSRRSRSRSPKRRRLSPANSGRYDYSRPRRSRSPPREYRSERRYSPVRYRSRSPPSRDDRKRRYEPYEEEEEDSSAVPRVKSSRLQKEIKDLLRIEHHHLIYEGSEDSDGDIRDVEWCYKFLDPSIRGHITGGKALLHHRCRQCNRICLHLLGKYNTGDRKCLECAARERGWRKEDVPSWYFHKIGQCRHCRPGQGSYHSYNY